MLLALFLQAVPASAPVSASSDWLLHHAPLLSLTVALLMPLVLFGLNRRTALRDKQRASQQEAARQQAAEEKADLEHELAGLRDAIGQFVDREALEKRFHGIEHKQALVSTEVANQHNILVEYERKRTELLGEIRPAIGQLQKDVAILEAMPGRVGRLESKLDNLVGQIDDLKSGQRDLRNDLKENKKELREDMTSNKSEILAAIKNLNH